MKSNLVKRILAMLLMLIIVFGISACSTPEASSGSSGDGKVTKADDVTPRDPDDDDDDDDEEGLVQASELSDPELCYVMVYNPKVYDEKGDEAKLTLGNMGVQVDVSGDRGDGLEEEELPPPTTIPQTEWIQYTPQDVELEDNRADVMGVDYELGDTQEFYYSPEAEVVGREKAEFTCTYVGEYCYIWTLDDVSQDGIDSLGEEFDENIYPTTTEIFGTPRFVGDTGKVNILIYDIVGSTMGYFANADLFTKSEAEQLTAQGILDFDVNTGHAIINVNAVLVGDKRNAEGLYSTTAHEFQHLINRSAFLETCINTMNSWLNESMSGYIETVLYDADVVKANHYKMFHKSDFIRNGQSLYNFNAIDRDYGVYGSVYYFSKYLEDISGKGIFSDIMEYWRTSYSRTLCTAEALAKCVSSDAYEDIDEFIDYTPLDLDFDSEEEEWMSKLTLCFYLETLDKDSDVTDFNNIKQSRLLYDNIDGADIEGGGRIVFALSGDSFEIPEDSDDGLIYVGLDKDFEPMEFIYK